MAKQPKNSELGDGLNPHLEARRVEAAAKEAERKRLFGRAQVVPLRGKVPDEREGFVLVVAGEDCVTPDGVHHRAGEVFLFPKDGEPSQTWCLLEDHVSQQKES
jgi:hypothetical protein